MFIGACHYPEQFDPAECERDAALMREAGFNVVRLGELAWSGLEPEPGEFRFDWMESVLEVFHRQGIGVLIGTPTASLPPWLPELDPDAMPVDDRGIRASYGAWGAACLSSPQVQNRTRMLVTALADRFGEHPAVVAWQLDNELLSNTCFCNRCRDGFQRWLAERYGDIEALNRAWGTAFWGHQYARWSQIPAPLRTVRVHHHNPGLRLDYARYMSDLNVRYIAMQAEILRLCAPGRPLTHNIPGRATHIDYFKLARELDFVGWDSYPTWIGKLPWGSAMGHDVTRGLKPGPFWVPEHQVGRMDQWKYGAVAPGLIRLWTYQAVARGAEGVLYFLWRAGPGGAEQYIESLVTHDGRRTRVLEEVAEAAREVQRLAPILGGTSVVGSVAVMHSYEDHWALAIQPMSADLENPWAYAEEWYRALFARNVLCDFVPASAEPPAPARCPLIIAPALYLVTSDLAERLRGYVEAGGALVLGTRSGSKDAHNAWPAGPLPGPLAELIGAEVEEFESLPAGECRKVTPTRGNAGRELSATIWFEALGPRECEPLLLYREGTYAGRPAAVYRRAGRGAVYYVGALGHDIVDWVLARAMAEAGVEPGPDAPEGVEIVTRAGPAGEVRFLLNHNRAEVRVPLPNGPPWRDALSGALLAADLHLPPYGVQLLAR